MAGARSRERMWPVAMVAAVVAIYLLFDTTGDVKGRIERLEGGVQETQLRARRQTELLSNLNTSAPLEALAAVQKQGELLAKLPDAEALQQLVLKQEEILARLSAAEQRAAVAQAAPPQQPPGEPASAPTPLFNPRASSFSEWHRPSALPGAPLVQFGDCRPFCERDRLRQLIPEFLQAFAERPHKINTCGQNLQQAWITFAIGRLLDPAVVVENGVNAGGGSYMLRRACPTAKIYHIDPLAHPICDKNMKRWMDTENAVYLTGPEKFVDFHKVDWAAEGIDKERTLVLFDTHVDDFADTIKSAQGGFRWLFYDDNYPGHERGDMNGHSVKQVLSRTDKDAYTLYQYLDMYYELPPLVLPLEHRELAHWHAKYPVPPVLPAGVRSWFADNHMDAKDTIKAYTEPLLDLTVPADLDLFGKIFEQVQPFCNNYTALPRGHFQCSPLHHYIHMAVARLRLPPASGSLAR